MTLLVPEAKFSVGSSAAGGDAAGADMSLDDMIKNRRKEQQSKSRKGVAGRKPATVDRVSGRNRAKRTAAVNARRGIKASTKPSAMEVEREVYRQARKTANARQSTLRKASGGRMSTRSTSPKKSRRVGEATTQKQTRRGRKGANSGKPTPPAWVGGTRRPPSKKAVKAATTAMTDAGFKIPEGMQMVISFAPAPGQDPTKQSKKGGKDNKKGAGKATGGRASGRASGWKKN